MGLQGLEQLGFVELAREEDQEIVYGLAGQPWRLSGNLQSVSAEDFSKFNDPGFAKVAWNFYVSALSDTSALLSTMIVPQTLCFPCSHLSDCRIQSDPV